MPVEVTKTVISRDGSRSITRENPAKYASKLRLTQERLDACSQFYNTSLNLMNQAKG